MPLDVPQPEELKLQRDLIDDIPNLPEAIRQLWSRDRAFEMKPVFLEHYTTRDILPPKQYVWMRLREELPDDRATQNAVLGYMSDMTLLDTATFAHGRALFDADIQGASLDHAMWFHRAHRLDDWVLYAADSPSSSGARGFARGMIFGRDGTLIASTAQEGLVRVRTSPRK